MEKDFLLLPILKGLIQSKNNNRVTYRGGDTSVQKVTQFIGGLFQGHDEYYSTFLVKTN